MFFGPIETDEANRQKSSPARDVSSSGADGSSLRQHGSRPVVFVVMAIECKESFSCHGDVKSGLSGKETIQSEFLFSDQHKLRRPLLFH